MTRTDIANLALSKLGAEPITSLETSDTKEGTHARLWYDQTLREVLRSHFWGFALGAALVGKSYAGDFAASVTLGRAADGNAITFTAAVAGPAGNAISVEVVEAQSASVFGVTVDGAAVTISQGVAALEVSGTTSPALPASLLPVAEPSEECAIYGLPMFSSDGTATGATTLGSYLFFLTSGLSLAALAPPADYIASLDPAQASLIQKFDPATGWASYWLYLNPTGLPYWATVGGTVNAGATVFAAASRINVQRARNWPAGGGPLGAAFAAGDTLFSWLLTSEGKVWEGIGRLPWTAEYAPLAGSPTGVPAVAAVNVTAGAAVTALTADPAVSLLVVAANATGSDGTGTLAAADRTFLSGGEMVPPDWPALFLIPADFLKLREMKTAGGDRIERFDMRRAKGQRYFVAGDFAAVVLEYVAYVDEPDDYDPLFVAAFTTLLAARMARAVTGSQDYETALLGRYLNEDLPAARVADGQDTRSGENRSMADFLAGDLLGARGAFFTDIDP